MKSFACSIIYTLVLVVLFSCEGGNSVTGGSTTPDDKVACNADLYEYQVVITDSMVYQKRVMDSVYTHLEDDTGWVFSIYEDSLIYTISWECPDFDSTEWHAELIGLDNKWMFMYPNEWTANSLMLRGFYRHSDMPGNGYPEEWPLVGDTVEITFLRK